MPAFPPGACLKGAQASIMSHVQLADEFYAPIIPIVAELRRQGLSLRAIARELDQRGIKTRQECACWNASQIRRVLARGVGHRTVNTVNQVNRVNPAEDHASMIVLKPRRSEYCRAWPAFR